MNEELIDQAMSIILHAGDARTYCEKALNYIYEFDFQQANENMALCDEEIIRAHMIHTKIVQQEAAGVKVEYYMLFAHAQDTLMTIASEIRITKKLMKMYQRIDERFSEIEKNH